MIIYTLHVTATSIIVHDGKLPDAQLKYYAPGLEIYVTGKISVPRRNAVSYEAMSLCLAHHIPLISLAAYGWI